jgi:hypothetical protein
MQRRQYVARLVVLLAFVALAGAACAMVEVPPAWAGTVEMNSCSGYGDSAADSDVSGMVWGGTSAGSLSTANECGQGRSFQIAPSSGTAKRGDNAQWHTVTPPALEIVYAVTPVNEVLIDSTSGDGFGADFFWSGGSQTIRRQNNCCGGMDYGSGINRFLGPSRYFGWQVSCQQSSCGQPLQILDVRGVNLVAVDNTPPDLLALGSNNIWYQSGRWIRSSGWPASFEASADDGVCSMREVVNGASVQGPYDPTRNTHSWTQCPSPQTMGMTVDTTQYANGPLSLVLSASDAASPANLSSLSTTLHVDNTPVTLSLTGPSDAPSTAGTQYVSAAATAGPSGVSAIYCSEDGSAYTQHPGARAEIPVSGIGSHQISCYAQNTSIDPDGRPASSPTQAFEMSIRQPTAAVISFSRIANALRCHGATVKIHVPGRPRTVIRHGRKVLIPGRGHVVKRRVTQCHARTVKRKVTVIVKRHGRPVKITKVRRVALLPHTVQKATRRVRHGKATTVSGYLETASGIPLAGRPVALLAAPDNGLGRFAPIAIVLTSSKGTWTARIPPGPSRLIESFYAGDGTTEPVASTIVKEVVPARVKIKITPRIVPWGSVIRITGRVLGGYVPTNSNLLRLNVGIGRIGHIEGLPDIQPEGTFSIVWKFNAGAGVVRPWFAVSTLSESAFPYAPASSNRVIVTLGEPTPPPPRAAKRHETKRHHTARRRRRAKKR